MAVDSGNMTMTVEAGPRAAEPAAAAGARRASCSRLSLAAEGSCTIGGNLATNAGGTQVAALRQHPRPVPRAQVVTAQGEVWEGTGLRKDNTGYDLRDL